MREASVRRKNLLGGEDKKGKPKPGPSGKGQGQETRRLGCASLLVKGESRWHLSAKQNSYRSVCLAEGGEAFVGRHAYNPSTWFRESVMKFDISLEIKIWCDHGGSFVFSSEGWHRRWVLWFRKPKCKHSLHTWPLPSAPWREEKGHLQVQRLPGPGREAGTPAAGGQGSLSHRAMTSQVFRLWFLNIQQVTFGWFGWLVAIFSIISTSLPSLALKLVTFSMLKRCFSLTRSWPFTFYLIANYWKYWQELATTELQ